MPIVHVAGTKGKGSTSAMVAAVLSAAGYRTGLFTSPHLDRVEERIVVDGQPCSAEELADLVERVRPAVEAMDRDQGPGARGEGSEMPTLQLSNSNLQSLIPNPSPVGPTYFEILTAMALDHFRRRRVDAAVLEVGLGGRLDSTNVCSPCVSIITSISFDHTKQLGETLAAIAVEKAGIIKPGVPVISGVDVEEPREVIRRIARQNGCRLVELGVDFGFDYRPPRHLERAASPAQFDFRYLARDSEHRESEENSRGLTAPGGAADTHRGLLAPGYFTSDVALGLLGRHQAANAAVALAAMEELRRQRLDHPRGRDSPRTGRSRLAGAGGSRRAAADRRARRRPQRRLDRGAGGSARREFFGRPAAADFRHDARKGPSRHVAAIARPLRPRNLHPLLEQPRAASRRKNFWRWQRNCNGIG